MSLASTGPTLFPLIGAFLLLVMPARWHARPLIRQLYLGALFGALIALIVLALGGVHVGILSLGSPFPMSIRAMSLVWDGLALQFAILAVVGLLLHAVLATLPERQHGKQVAVLVAVGACVAGCAAADVLTLCICWGTMDVALILSDLWYADETQAVLGRQRIWARALALLCLTVAAMLLSFDQGRTEWAYAALDRNVQSLIMVAAWLRLTGFPLPVGSDVGQPDRLIALSTGGYLWLRLGSVALLSPGQPWLVALASVGLGAMGLTALLAQDHDRRLEALHLHGVTMLLLAPLIDPVAGFGVAGLLAIGLGVVLVMQIGSSSCSSAAPWGRWSGASRWLALGSLAGLPLTLGGVGHWHFLRLAYLAGQRGVFVIASTSFVLVAVACWRSGKRLWDASPHEVIQGVPGQAVDWRSWTRTGCLVACSIYLILTGIYPAGAERLWRNGFAGIDLPGLRTALSGPASMLGVLALADLLLPLAGVWVIERLTRKKLLWYRGPARDVLERLLCLDWLYLGLEQGLAVLQSALLRSVPVLEESFVLGWSFFWALVFVFYTLRV